MSADTQRSLRRDARCRAVAVTVQRYERFSLHHLGVIMVLCGTQIRWTRQLLSARRVDTVDTPRTLLIGSLERTVCNYMTSVLSRIVIVVVPMKCDVFKYENGVKENNCVS